MALAIQYQRLFLFVFSGLSVGIFFLPYFIEIFPIKQTCLFSAVTGHPSPTCGTTRALVSLLHGNLSLALEFNPLAVVTWLAVSICLLQGAFRGGFLFRWFQEKERLRRTLFLLIGLAMLNWYYLWTHESFLQLHPLQDIPLLF